MFSHWMKTLLCGILATMVLAVQAEGGIAFDKTRAVIQPGRNESSFIFKNESNWGYLLKSSIEDADGTKALGVLVTPVVTKALPESSQRIRIVITDPTRFPTDRETMLWYVGTAIPAQVAKDAVMQINFVNRIKVFYRPSGLSGNYAQAVSSLKVGRTGTQLSLQNDSPFVISMSSYRINGKLVDTSEVVQPFSTLLSKKVTLPEGAVDVEWEALDENGALVSAKGKISAH